MPKILNIITEPNPNLRQVSPKISPERLKDAEFQEFIADMKETMVKKDGVGLAAPQVDRQIRLIVISTKEGPTAMINPEISQRSWRKNWGEEGCLSVPKTFGQVRRHQSLVCDFYDEKGVKKTIKANGFMARIIQHEVDHLDGILFIDKAKKIRKLD